MRREIMDLQTVDELLTTTRSVRKRLDFTRPVDPAVIEECLELAVQAPIASNWPWYYFMVVTDPAKRKVIADYYRHAIMDVYLPWRKSDPAMYDSSGPGFYDSLVYLADHLHEVPVHIIPCVQGRPHEPNDWPPLIWQTASYGSIYPAMWSLMLALRSRGLGASWTMMHVLHEQEVADLLSLPNTVTQVGLLAVAHYTGTTFKRANRLPAREHTYWDTWGQQHESEQAGE
jgi:nitroreductase